MKTVMVTGGAGFIGSHLCETLLNFKYKVLCVDNLLTGRVENISKVKKIKTFHLLNTILYFH